MRPNPPFNADAPQAARRLTERCTSPAAPGESTQPAARALKVHGLHAAGNFSATL